MEHCYYGEGPNWADQYQTATAVSNESSSFQVPWPHVTNSTQFQFCGGVPPSWSSTAEGFIEEDRAASASKSHSQAEKRRRDRINAQLATLRKLIPQSDKMDKAALLGSVIDEVKDLKRKANEVSETFMLPTENDDLTVSHCDLDHEGTPISPINSTNINKLKANSVTIRVSVCCDDQPELFRELIQVLKRLKLNAIKADIASAGGRIKSILVLCSNDSEEAVSISNLKQALKLVLSKIAASSVTPNCRIRSKRQRFLLPFQYPK